MASRAGQARASDGRRDRHGRHHLAGNRQRGELGKADRRQLRHPPHHAVSDRGLQDDDRRHCRLHSGRTVLLDRARRTHGGHLRPRRLSPRPASAAKGDFPGPLFLAVAPVEIEWPHRDSFAAASGANDSIGYDDLLRASASGRFHAIHERCLFASVADHLADRFGTKGSPISLSTACASGASAIQLGVEAIRRGETEAALCIGTDGSVNPECLIRFSLLSALSTANDPPQAAAKPFSKDRDGFVMAEGAAAS